MSDLAKIAYTYFLINMQCEEVPFSVLDAIHFLYATFHFNKTYWKKYFLNLNLKKKKGCYIAIHILKKKKENIEGFDFGMQ